MAKNKVIFDADDFCPDRKRNAMDWLYSFRAEFPGFKVTLFTIPATWSTNLLQSINGYKWIELGMHGFEHSSGECLEWDRNVWISFLESWEELGLPRLFKAPEWKMKKEDYKILLDMGWAVAVRKHQIKDLPENIKYYCFETNPCGVHGHTWTMHAHKEEGKFEWNKDTKFEFVTQNLEIKR